MNEETKKNTKLVSFTGKGFLSVLDFSWGRSNNALIDLYAKGLGHWNQHSNSLRKTLMGLFQSYWLSHEAVVGCELELLNENYIVPFYLELKDKLGLKPIFEYHVTRGKENWYTKLIAASDACIVMCDGSECFIAYTDAYTIDTFISLTNKYDIVDSTPAEISILVQGQYGLETDELCVKERALLESHYKADVYKSLLEAKKNLTTPEPFGRITILTGPPGTGKTSYIRSLLTDHNCTFLLIPAGYVHALQDTSILPVFLQLKNSEKPIVLIIEDADTALEVRDGSNTSQVGTLLNTVDGLLTDYLDIRVIATTNLTLDKVDPALSRPGRLNALINVGNLSLDEAKRAYDHLTEMHGDQGGTFDEKLAHRGVTIAQVYQMFYGADLLVLQEQKGTFGF